MNTSSTIDTTHDDLIIAILQDEATRDDALKKLTQNDTLNEKISACTKLMGGTEDDAFDLMDDALIDLVKSIQQQGLPNQKTLSVNSFMSREEKISATLIEKIEVITNPSSKYSSSGTAGILNIILRKNKKSGLNGSITASIRKAKSNKISANISLKRKNINIFSNINLADTERLGTSFFENVFYDELDNVSSAENESRLMDRKTKSFRTNFGVELFIDETSSVTNAINYSKINGSHS